MFFCFFFFLAAFQDVNVIVILGFGFLGTFLVRYSFSASAFNLLVAVTATQWAIVLNGIEYIYYRGTARINLRRWVINQSRNNFDKIFFFSHTLHFPKASLIENALCLLLMFFIIAWLLRRCKQPLPSFRLEQCWGRPTLSISSSSPCWRYQGLS